MKYKYLLLLITFSVGFISCYIIVGGGIFNKPTYVIKQDLVLSNMIHIPKDTYVKRIKDMPEGYSIYAIFFQHNGYNEEYIVYPDSLSKGSLRSYIVNEDLILKNE